MNRIAAVLFALAAAPAFAAPDEVQAEYQIQSNGIVIGRVQENYARKGGTYSIQSVTRSEGILKAFLDDEVSAHSDGRFGPKGLRPNLFEQKRRGNASRDMRASFDWNKRVMQAEFRGETKEHALPDGTQDRLSVFYQFMNTSPKADVLELQVVNGRKVERYTYRKVDEPRLATPAGEFETIHYARVLEDGQHNRTEVWLAKDRHYLPVRIVVDGPKGLMLDQTLVSLRTQ